MKPTQYPPARLVAPRIREHFERHLGHAQPAAGEELAKSPDDGAIAAIVDAAFWASLKHEEGFVPSISLAWVPPEAVRRPLLLSRPLPLSPEALTRLSPAVERPGIHLGVWREGDELQVWGTTRTLPPFCFVTEVAAAGLIVLKHRRREQSGKFVNVAVLEGDAVKLVDARSARRPDCPALVTTLLGLEANGEDSANALSALALSMRQHGRGGSLLVVPDGSASWEESIVKPIPYPVAPPFAELSGLMAAEARERAEQRWQEAFRRSVDAIAGLTAVDGATLMTDRYALLAFGAKIGRREGGARVEQVVLAEPIEGYEPRRIDPGQLGGTRHQSAAQFVQDQHDALALVASQDRHFTVFAWSPCEKIVLAQRVEALLL